MGGEPEVYHPTPEERAEHRRMAALDFAIRAFGHDTNPDRVVEAAAEFDAFLRGER